MNCRRVEELMPLYVETDLEESESQAVSLHLDWCERCEGLFAKYRDSQAWMRSKATADFDDVFFDDMRLGVLRSIEESRPRPNWIQMIAERLQLSPVMAATAALLILIGGFALYVYISKDETRSINKEEFATEQRETQEEQKENEQDGKEPETEKRAIEKRKLNLPRRRVRQAAVAVNESTEPQPVRESGTISEPTISESRESIPAENDFGSEGVKMPEGMTRIEIQTKDPNIRIIWFAPKPDDSRPSRPVTE